ncbi:amino acid ABC transporter, permease protein [Azorhizobium caulinodans ORS 571]|uniref:Amino acid ABC transporter, permease protein n=1 Tax=Azorhizobium caulinodans (strain ATCC 43989 / DSM 5975 / JCM 20966 / LMG 6465 / NBRC 14845 / NCIMB 13405 / ORS 571) TaxID=438753 RepID=A8IB67_AZOC5|nr:amino acid ABC transporter permease [Azorhizobium caulinodans]BAF88615.1 amino acid ABC transporter, permease protein [Azorhizobium caulinodans ORS 571]
MLVRSFGLNDFIFLLESLRWTLVLTAIALTLGGIAGLFIALARVSPLMPLRLATAAYIQIIQGSPVLMILFLSYYGLSLIGFQLPALVAASISMSIYVSGYLGDIWRGCIEAVPKPQWEASECLGMTRVQQFRHIILPQALRIALPPTTGFAVQVVKNTSITSIIGFVELSRAGQLINNSTFQPFRVFLTVAAIYFVICYPLSRLSGWLERKLNVGSSH